MTIDGGKPHQVGDRGQRYEISVYDHVHKRRIPLGWSETEIGARQMADAGELRPTWSESKIRDRQAPEGAQEIAR